MPTLKKTQKNIELVSSIKNITSAYQKLAKTRMQEIRREVLETRTFLEGVGRIYHHAKGAYLASLNKEEELKEASFIRRNNKKVIIFLSANERFYGTLLLNTWQKVQEYLDHNTADFVVTGKVGRQLAQEQLQSENNKYFDLSDEQPTEKEKRKIFEFIKKYEEIIVFHGRFKTIFHQEPEKTNISGGVSLEEPPEATKDYLFEPSPEAILSFFEEEIIEALFHQSILEHQLARFASRMVAMDQASQNADEKLEKLKNQANKLKKRIENRKQLNRVIRTHSTSSN